MWRLVGARRVVRRRPTFGTFSAISSELSSPSVVTRNSSPASIARRSTPALEVVLPVTSSEVSKIITSSPDKQCPLASAPMWLIKHLCPVLSVTIANICDASFTKGVLPTTQKDAIVRPRMKKLIPDHLNSYRPISNLSFLSKSIERLVAARFNEHVKTHNLLPSRQSAYQAHHLTETAVIDVLNRIIRNVDRGGHVSVLVLLDLNSAFDTADHAILLEVLESVFGVAGIALDWFRSYLDGRTQTFYVGAQQSGTFLIY